MHMGYFPFFIDVEGRNGLIVGGGKVAGRKIRKLLPFGAHLTVVAPVVLPQIKKMPGVLVKEREFRDEDMKDCTFVIAASDDRELNHRISQLCKEQNVLVNVVDDKKTCSFLFPALLKRGSFTAGISTEGVSPQIAASVRSKMEEELPGQMESILGYLKELRENVRQSIPDGSLRGKFLKEAALLCMEKDRPLTVEEAKGLFVSCENSASVTGKKNGTVVLVGAGCGPADYITVRGLNEIRKAEVLVYDDLMDEKLLDHASESCERIYVGKRMGVHSMKQEEINALLIRKAQEGKRVVRLKGGDPFVFGRGGEEIQALHKEGIDTALVPGVTSAVCVPALAGIPVTHRGLSRSFHVITGHTADRDDSLPENLDTIAALEGTCIFLMGLSNIQAITDQLIAHGKSPDTPAAVVHGDFNGKSISVRGTLREIAKKTKEVKIPSPAVIVVGETAGIEL